MELNGLFELIRPLIEIYGGKIGVVAQVVTLVGTARLIVKPFHPLVAAIKQVINATPTMKDDEFLKQAEASRVYKTVKFLVDYLLSIKLR